MTNILSVLIWVQTVCKGYQQMIKVAASKLCIFFFFSLYKINRDGKYVTANDLLVLAKKAQASLHNYTDPARAFTALMHKVWM